MKKLKKIWLWISGAIVSLVGLFFIFSKVSDSNKEKRDFKNKNKDLEKNFKETQKEVEKTATLPDQDELLLALQ